MTTFLTPPFPWAKVAYARVPGLANDRPVTFTVTAINAAGTGGPSLPSFAITPSGRKVQPPPPPSSVSAHPVDNGEVSIHFQAPHVERESSPITAYAVTVVPGGRKVMFTGRNVLTLEGKHTTFKVISGLKPGTYTFRISAVNEAGAGEPAVTGPVTLR